MPITVLLVSVVFAIPALALGSRKVFVPRRWDQRRRPLRPGEVIDRVVVMALRAGLLLLLAAMAVLAIVGSAAALKGHVGLPNGVVIACVATALLSLLTLTTFARPHR